MSSYISNFFSPDQHQVPLQNETLIQKKYRQYRWSVFISATLGYALFYVCRLSLSVVKKPLVDAQILTESELGQIGSALFFSYAIGKLVNGFISDKININRFISLGLLLTAFCNIALGMFPAFYVFLILWGLSGWFQSAGAAPCVVALSRWFTSKERGTYYGIWSASHNIGKAITFSLLPFLIGIGGWRWGFYGAGIAGVLGAIAVYIFLHDSPQSKALPAIDDIEKNNSNTQAQSQPQSQPQSISQSQKSILKNPYIWLLALASSLMYISRYAIESWGIFYAQTEKNYSNIEAGNLIGLTAISGIIGTVISGIVSDKFFRSSRNVPALVAGVLNIAGLSIFLFYPHQNYFIDAVSMLIHGFAIGILITFLGGLMAVDIAPKQATGAAMGLIGIASYIGAGIQDLISGAIINNHKSIINNIAHYDFSIAKYFWLGAAILSIIIALLVWKAKKE